MSMLVPTRAASLREPASDPRRPSCPGSETPTSLRDRSTYIADAGRVRCPARPNDEFFAQIHRQLDWIWVSLSQKAHRERLNAAHWCYL